MKRALSALLLIAMLLLSLACAESGNSPTTATQEQPEMLEETPEAALEADVADTPQPTVQTGTVLSDAGGIVLAVRSIDADEDGYTLTISMSNDTQSYGVATVSSIINGWVGDQHLLLRAEPETEASAQLCISKDFLDLCEIDEVAEILLPFSITNEDFEKLASGTGAIYPAGEEAAETIPAYQYAAKKSNTVLLNDDNAFAVVMELDSDDPDGYAIQIYIENRSDRAIQFQLSHACINNYVHQEISYDSPSIPAGASIMIERDLDAEAMERDGIRAVTKIDFDYVLEYDDSEGGTIASDEKTIYPLGKDAVRNPLHVAQKDETVLLDNAYYTVIVTACDTASDPERYGIDFYLENNTNRDLDFYIENMEVNGVRRWSAHILASIPAGKRCNTSLAWNRHAFDQADFMDETPVESLTLPLIFYCSDRGESGELIYENTFTVKTW